MKVLVVDDEPIVLKSCRVVLADEGCEVLLAESVAEALPLIEAGVPGLILIDVKMPGQDGMFLMRRLRETGVAIPVIVMSGYSTRDTVREAEALGAAAFLSKPFTPDELAEMVRTVLKTHTAVDEKEERHGPEKGTGDR